MSGTIPGRVMAIALLLTLGASLARGQSNYGLHEQRRLQAISDQIGLQDYLRWQSGLPSLLSPARPPSLESIYSGLADAPGAFAPWRTDVFEPWPFVPGDIWGRQFDNAVPQPWGHRITPLGRNGYTYEPVHGPPRLKPSLPGANAPLPPAVLASPAMPPPAKSLPPEELPAPPSGALREF